MRLFHLADLHIGKVINNFSMLEDQCHALNQIKELVKEHKPNAVILAGDIYDRSVPPAEAVALFSDFLHDVLLELKTPVIAIAGNHDSADRLQFGSSLFEKTNLYIEGTFNKEVRKVKLYDEHGVVNFYLVPFADAAVVREAFGDIEIKSLNDAMTRIVEKIMEDFSDDERHIMITHGYIKGSEDVETCESEKSLIIGGTENVDVDLFKRFHYTALGHLHGSQRVGSDRVRYSGSLIKYSFSEERHKKSVTMVDMDGDGNVEINLLELSPPRDMRSIKGNLSELIKPEVYKAANPEDYIRAILTDDGELVEPMAKLRQVYPNIMMMEVEKRLGNLTSSLLSSKDRAKKTAVELFRSFYTYHTNNEISSEGLEVAEEIMKELEGEVS